MARPAPALDQPVRLPLALMPPKRLLATRIEGGKALGLWEMGLVYQGLGGAAQQAEVVVTEETQDDFSVKTDTGELR